MIFEQIVRAYTGNDNNKTMKFFFSDQPDLESVTTTKDEAKKKKTRTPVTNIQPMNL